MSAYEVFSTSSKYHNYYKNDNWFNFLGINLTFVSPPTLNTGDFYEIGGCNFKSLLRIDVQHTYIIANGKKLNRTTFHIIHEDTLSRRRRAVLRQFRFQSFPLSQFINGKYRCAIYHPRFMAAPVLSTEIEVNLKREYNYKTL